MIKKYSKICFFVLLVLLVLLYFSVPIINSKINGLFTLFSFNNVEIIIGYIRSYGAYAVVISFFLMIFQSIAAPLPAFLITFANATVFGWWQGAILSWTSAMAGAAICFFIARLLGREVVEKLINKLALQQIDQFFLDFGKHTILISRLLPFVSFDLISYAAGLTSIRFWSFMIATGIGQLPATIIYYYVGGMLTGGVATLVTALLFLFAFSIIIFMVKDIYLKKKRIVKSDHTL